MRGPVPESRRGAALVVAIVVVLVIVAMMVFFLEQSIGYSARATEDSVRTRSLEVTEIGMATAYQRIRNNFPLDNYKADYRTDPDGRVWSHGEVNGDLDLQDGSDAGSYHVEVFWSGLEKIRGKADKGSDSALVDADLTKTPRPATWFIGKKFMMTTGELAGAELVIETFDPNSGTITFATQSYFVAAGDQYEIPAGMEYQFLSEGTHARSTRSVETWWWRQSKPLKKYTQRGAVVANGKVQVLGNIQIDGRDHCANGGQDMPSPENCPSADDHHIVDPGVKGVSTTGLVDQSGSSTIGGDGTAPQGSPDGLGHTEQYPDPASIDNGNDDDSDGMRDEDPYNGVDDDRNALGEIVPDGKRDEDLRFPRSPDEALGLKDGTLKEIARGTGTYFATQAAFDKYYVDHESVLPGGQVYYLDIPLLDYGKIQMDMSGSDEPEDDDEELKPVIFIVHHTDGSGELDGQILNMFIIVKGLVMCDVLNKVNGGTRIVGGLQTLSDSESANIFGNGNARIWYSTAALANLPDNVNAAAWNTTTWRETH